MHANEQLLTNFYSSFQRLDASGMISCYSPEIHFSDPIYQNLHGKEVGAMWQMLTERAKDFKLTFHVKEADDIAGAVHWEAAYLFSATGRNVINRIDSTFQFQQGKILVQKDIFPLWRWASQAIGSRGVWLGWTPLVQNTIRKQANGGLQRYIQQQAKSF